FSIYSHATYSRALRAFPTRRSSDLSVLYAIYKSLFRNNFKQKQVTTSRMIMSNHLLLAPMSSTSSVTSSTSKHLLKTKSMLALAALLALAGCSNGQNETNESASAETTKTSEAADNNSAAIADDNHVLRIGTEGAYAPFNYTNADGTLGGFDVEIANGICADLQMTCEIIAQDWDGIIPGLKAG